MGNIVIQTKKIQNQYMGTQKNMEWFLKYILLLIIPNDSSLNTHMGRQS